MTTKTEPRARGPAIEHIALAPLSAARIAYLTDGLAPVPIERNRNHDGTLAANPARRVA